jgi:hypothetical protein
MINIHLRKLLPYIMFVLVAGTILGLNVTPLIAHIRHTPAGTQFSYIHNNVQDFYFYQSLMNQGRNGNFLIRDPFTTENHQPSLIFAYFPWWGFIGKILNLPNIAIYHGIRLLAGFFALLTTFFLIRRLRFPYPTMTFILASFAAPLLKTANPGGVEQVVPYMYFWTGMDPIRRAAYLPHHMVGAFLLLFCLLLLLSYIQKGVRRNLIIALLLAVPMGFIHTPSLFVLLLVLPSAYLFTMAKITLMSYLKHAQFSIKKILFENENPRILLATLFFCIIGSVVLLTMLTQTNKGFPWSQYLTWEKTQQFPLDRELMGAFGILVPFTLMGAFIGLVGNSYEWSLVSCWFLLPLLLSPFAAHLNLSNIRLIQGVPYLPLSMLAVLAVTTIQRFFNRTFRGRLNVFINKRIPPPRSKNVGVLLLRRSLNAGGGHWIIGLLLIIFTLFTVPTVSWSVKDQIREYWTPYSNVYLDSRLFRAFDFINITFPSKTNTLATFYSGNYLPAFTDTVSYIGHTGYTYNVNAKEELVDQFFKGKMPTEDVKKLLTDNNITLIYQGPDEKGMFRSYLYPELLKPVYDKPEATLYTLK